MCLSSDGSAASSSQRWLIISLTFWLLLTIGRQAFDLIGKLWIPVAFNLLQVLSCISGLFAAWQCRRGLLIALCVCTVISMSYNAALMLWYGNWLGNTRQSAWLSAGLPFGHSFFLRYTPLCGAHFNLTASQWEQNTNCIFPYWYLEGVQAVFHILLAISTFVLTIFTLVDLSRGRLGGNCNKYAAYDRRNGSSSTETTQRSSQGSKKENSRTGQVTTSVALNGALRNGNLKKTNLVPKAPDSVNDLSSGYMNSSYESPVEGGTTGMSKKQYPSNNNLLTKSQRRIYGQQNSQRHKKIISNLAERDAQQNGHEHFQPSKLDIESEHHSDSSTDTRSAPLPPPPPNCMPLPPTSSCPPPFPADPINNYVSTRIYARNGQASGSSRFKQPPPNGHNHRPHSSVDYYAGSDVGHYSSEYLSPYQINGVDHNQNEKLRAISPSPYYSQPKHKIQNEKTAGGSLRIYGTGRQKNTEYGVQMNSRGGSERRGSATNLTSLISFDPKSTTLIRVRKHQNESSFEDDEMRDAPRDEDSDAYVHSNVLQKFPVTGPPAVNSSRHSLHNSGQLENNQQDPLRAFGLSGSQDSVPSMRAPAPPSYPASIQPIRQRMIPSSSSQTNLSAIKSENMDTKDTSGEISPDWSQVGIQHPRQAPGYEKSHASIGLQSNPTPANASIYECIGNRPMPSTAFPAVNQLSCSQPVQPRSVTGVSVASAISLSRDYGYFRDPPQQSTHMPADSRLWPVQNIMHSSDVQQMPSSSTFLGMPHRKEVSTFDDHVGIRSTHFDAFGGGQQISTSADLPYFNNGFGGTYANPREHPPASSLFPTNDDNNGLLV
ncbi:na,K-Atpase interacting protein [Ditylenchus destructor]|nr:na,K-Atpase interacting protein [Ditylenchus destructor]